MIALSIWGLLNGCAARSLQDLIERDDHAALVNHYTDEAQKFRQKAQEWEKKAAFYEARDRRNPLGQNPHELLAFERHATHCRMIAQNNRRAAEEAEALANEHQKQLQQTPK